jgi:GxxExxY protein
MHPHFEKADALTRDVIAAAIEVHRVMGPGLLESIYEKCLLHELQLAGIMAIHQTEIDIKYKDIVFTEQLRFDVLVENCLLVEVKAVAQMHPVHKAQLLSYMKILNAPVGLICNFHECRLVDSLSRVILRGADQCEG